MFEKYFQIIIDEISKLVTADICFIDCSGHILKSSQPSRIGQFHPHAKNSLMKILISWQLIKTIL